MSQVENIQAVEVNIEVNIEVKDRFRLSPLIQITLLSLYFVLTIPLPYLAVATQSEVPGWLLWGGIVVGAIGLYGALDERVTVDETGIAVSYPKWFPFRKGWQLNWSDIRSLKDRSTGQGGLVYYFVSKSEEAFLLPMRVAGFARLLKHVEAKTEIDTRDVRPLSQPWMYFILLGLTILLGLVDAWTIAAARSLAGNG